MHASEKIFNKSMRKSLHDILELGVNRIDY